MKPIWIWLFPVGVIALALYVAYRNYPWWGDEVDKWCGFVLGVLATALCCLIAGATGMGLSTLIGDHCAYNWEQDWSARMVSMRSADGLNGSISGGVFMLSGQINSGQVYYYYTLNSDGSFAPHKWRPDSDTVIFEEARTDGRVIGLAITFRRQWLSWIAEPSSRYRMEFHIPAGSLRQSFSLQ